MNDPAPAVATAGVGPFVTRAHVTHPDGTRSLWESRVHRKHQRPRRTESMWWAPAERGWWIAVLFAVGSFLFALGTVPAYVQAVGITPDAVTYFVGSIFFTSAGFLTYREAVDAGSLPGPHRRVFVRQRGRIDWWSSGVQLVGTLFFNISTANAIRVGLSATAARHHVWRPDALGSICFLVASALAWLEVSHRWWSWRPSSWSWWIAGLNLIGSIAFGVSAVAAFVVPSTGQLWSSPVANFGTFVGALCFLAGAILLLPERMDDRGAEESRRAAASGLVPGLPVLVTSAGPGAGSAGPVPLAGPAPSGG